MPDEWLQAGHDSTEIRMIRIYEFANAASICAKSYSFLRRSLFFMGNFRTNGSEGDDGEERVKAFIKNRAASCGAFNSLRW
jgi:hypothetical protein